MEYWSLLWNVVSVFIDAITKIFFILELNETIERFFQWAVLSYWLFFWALWPHLWIRMDFFNWKLLDIAVIENQFIASNVRKSDNKLKKKIQNIISPQISLYNQTRDALKCEFTYNILTSLGHNFDLIAFQIRGRENLQKIHILLEKIGWVNKKFKLNSKHEAN